MRRALSTHQRIIIAAVASDAEVLPSRALLSWSSTVRLEMVAAIRHYHRKAVHVSPLLTETSNSFSATHLDGLKRDDTAYHSNLMLLCPTPVRDFCDVELSTGSKSDYVAPHKKTLSSIKVPIFHSGLDDSSQQKS